MGIKMRRKDGLICYISIAIECDEYQVIKGEDGIIERIDCTSKTLKTECEKCSLVNKFGYHAERRF
jgi:hypothetical protein